MKICLPINLGILFRPNTPYDKWHQLAPIVEESGFESIWAGSTPSNWDVCNVLNTIIHQTKEIPVGLSLTNPYIKHPAATAISAISMNNLSKGRFILTYGAGTLEGLHSIGMDWDHPVLSCREAITATRRIINEECVNYKGKTLYITDFHPNCKILPNTTIPIYLGARRPHMLQLAGELCDGVILDHPPLDHVNYDLEQIERGAKHAKRTLMHDTFSVSMACPFSVSKNGKEAKDHVRHQLTLPFISITPRELKAAGLTFDQIKPIQDVMGTRTPDTMRNAAQHITHEMVDEFAIAGTPEECLKRIIAYEDAGINRIILAVSTTNMQKAQETLQLAKEEILPALCH